jgi:hypothetical protein
MKIMHSIQTTSVNKTSLKYQNIQLKKKNQKLQKEKLDLVVVVVVVNAVTGRASECVDKTHYDSRCD